MELKGYAMLKEDAQPTFCVGSRSEYIGMPVRIMDIGCDGSVLVVTPAGTALGDFPKEAVARMFRCQEVGEVVCPHELDPVQRMLYVGRCLSRKGGYPSTVRALVIASSLAKGAFTDSFLWAKQGEETVTEEKD